MLDSTLKVVGFFLIEFIIDVFWWLDFLSL
jgi:hypothetical protein